MSAPFNPFQSGVPAQPPAAGSAAAVPPGSVASAATLEPLQVTQPPIPLLAAAGMAAVAGLVVAAVGWQSSVSLLGWALSGPLAFGLMGAFVSADTRRRAEPVYVRPGWIGGVYAVAATISAIGIIVGAIGFALWMGRQ